jgi:hypothetical protein
MKLIIEVVCNDGLDMEINLNRAIDDFSKALKSKGFGEMELIAYQAGDIYSEPIYKVLIQ